MSNGIDKARAAAGGKDVDIARLLNISPAAVSRWGGIVPAARAIEIEKLTGGKVTRHDIRPDFFGAAPAGKKTAKPTAEAAPRGVGTFRARAA